MGTENNKKIFVVPIALITNEQGQIFLTKRHQPDRLEWHEKWEFPGGGIEYGESPEQTVVREAKEETGFDVRVVRLLPRIYTNDWGDLQVILPAYECKIISGEFNTDDPEISEGKFFGREEINYDECLPLTKEIIELLDQ